MREWAPPKNDQDRLDWLRLFRSENIGPATFFSLMGRYPDAATALKAVPDLAKRGGLKRNIKLASAGDAEAEIEAMATAGARLLFWGEPDFPPLLMAIEQGPPLLTVRGNVELLSRPTLAMVGARNASAAGKKLARDLAGTLGAQGYVIASGLARGIDTAAHEGALGTGTIAVMAGGADHIYPPQNEALFHQIEEQGAILSEMPWGFSPQARNFPRRNRIVSGLSLGVVVVEAAARSGSLITARYAAEQNRDVFAVPGSPMDPRAEGSNRLIQDGAKLVMSAPDITDGLEQMSTAHEFLPRPQSHFEFDESVEPPESLHDELMTCLGGTPIGLDDLVRETGQAPATIGSALLELELAGKVERRAGALFCRCFEGAN